MKYLYGGKNYPKEIKLNHPEIEEILSKDFDLMTRRDYQTIFIDGRRLCRRFQQPCPSRIRKAMGNDGGRTGKRYCRYIYDKGMVDEDYCGDLDNTLFGLNEGAYMDEPVTNSFQIFFSKIPNSFS